MKNITILKYKQENPKLFMTMDIETMYYSSQHNTHNTISVAYKDYQIPVAISLAYFNHRGIIQHKVVIINSHLLAINEDKAITDLWFTFFKDLIHIVSFHSEFKHRCIIFMHNLGKFDGLYLIKGLFKIVDYKDVHTIINKENEFIEISAKINNIKFIWKDSLRIFNVSLLELCDIFKSQNRKLNLYKSEYNNVNLFKDSFLLEEFKQYSAQDAISLLEVLKIAQELYFHHHKVDITTIWSASTLAMKIFRLNYLKQPIPVLRKYLDDYIRESYFGGITDTYQLYGENIYYYDVNSLYPYAMLNPMPSKLIKFYDSMEEVDFSQFFGFCTARIIAPKYITLPLLPHRLKDGNVIYPTGQWVGTYFSEELKTVMKYGYKVIPLEGYSFEKEYFFKDYVDYFYNLKKNAHGPLRFIVKNLLNNLYGYFGRSLSLINTVNVNYDELKKYLSSKLIHSIIPVDENIGIYLLLVSNHLKQNIIKTLNLKLIQSNQPKIQNNIKYVKANVAIASAITSYARIHMMDLKMKLINMGYTIYYSDTDSLFINKPLPESFINNELGGLKDELEGMIISKAYFLGPKKYGYQIKLSDDSLVDKSVFAGVTRNSLSFNEIEKLAKGDTLHKTKSLQFNRDMEHLNISITNNIPIILKQRANKHIINNNYITPHISEFKLKYSILFFMKKCIQTIKNMFYGTNRV